LEFKSNLRYFSIFHFSILVISLAITVLQYALDNQTYSHFLFRISFLCLIAVISLLILLLMLSIPSIAVRSQGFFLGLSVLTVLYLTVCDERILSGLSKQPYNPSLQQTVWVIALYIVMMRNAVLNSFQHILFISIFSLSIALVLFMVFSSISIVNCLSEFCMLLGFTVLQLWETHDVDYRTRQLFWRKQMEEDFYDNIAFDDDNSESSLNINTEIELIIQSCDRIKQTIKAASAVIMFKDVKRRLKSAQVELERVKRRMAQGGFTNIQKLEKNPGISENDKQFIIEHYTDVSNTIIRHTRMKEGRMSVVQFWSNRVSEIEHLMVEVGTVWNFDIWFVHTTTGHSVSIMGQHLMQKWQLVSTLAIPRENSDNFFLTLERVIER
jgi:hypothetical protein